MIAWGLGTILALTLPYPGQVRGDQTRSAAASQSRPPADSLPLLPAPEVGPSPAASPPSASGRKADSGATAASRTATKAGAESPSGAGVEPDLVPPASSAEIAASRAETAQRIQGIGTAKAVATEGAKTQVNAESAESSPAAAGQASSNGDKSAVPVSASAARTGTAAPKASDKALRDVLQERLHWLDEHDQAARTLEGIVNLEPSPERQAADAKTELERLQAQLSQPLQNLLPPVFRVKAAEVTETARGEMKAAIEEAKNELKESSAKLEALRLELTKTEGTQNALRAERDKLFQRIATLKARSQERATAVTAAKTPESRQLAQERMVNFGWEARVETLRLKITEAKLALEVKLADLRELNRQVHDARLKAAQKTLDAMQSRYRELAETQERDLKRAAASEESKADRSNDPLDRYRARRSAELLELEAHVVKNEQALATNVPPSLEEQRRLADGAEADFAHVKQLLDDGRVSRLDALRLNNDFRRIGPERDRLLRNELATVEAQLQYYENMLTTVEIELIEDSLVDQAEQEMLLERLDSKRHARAQAEFTELEGRHRTLLVRRRAALEKLVARASQTLEQVNRRLRTLEEEYSFIRTHIFWVRDQEPMDLQTVRQGGYEFKRMVKGFVRLAEETVKLGLWGQPSAEFLSAAVAVLVLPLGLFRLRRLLRRRIEKAFPPVHLHGDRSETIKVDMSPVIKQG